MIKRKYDFEPYADNCMATKRQKDLDYINIGNFMAEAKLPTNKRKGGITDDNIIFSPKKHKQFDNIQTEYRIVNVEVYADVVIFRHFRDDVRTPNSIHTKITSFQVNIGPNTRTIDMARNICERLMSSPHIPNKMDLFYKDRQLLDNELLFNELDYNVNPVINVVINTELTL